MNTAKIKHVIRFVFLVVGLTVRDIENILYGQLIRQVRDGH